jgi:5'-3' exonuclease
VLTERISSRVVGKPETGNCSDNFGFAAREESPESLSGSHKIACGVDRSRMNVHLIDGTYELFRHFFGVPAAQDVSGQEIGAVRGVLTSVLSMIERGATHIGVATDHVVESFRNDLYPGYKTSEGVPPELLSQFPILEEALEAMGVVVWAMVYFEADDALASAAGKAAQDERVRQVLICTPDKDLSQCVVGSRVVQLDRRCDVLHDETGVVAKFGVKQFRTTLLWSATARMDSPVCLVGA